MEYVSGTSGYSITVKRYTDSVDTTEALPYNNTTWLWDQTLKEAFVYKNRLNYCVKLQ